MPKFDLFPTFLKNLDPNIYKSNNYRVIDFETTNLESGSPFNDKNRVVAFVCLDGRTGEINNGYYDLVYGGYKEILNLLEDADFIVAQSAKFELQWLYRLGLDPGSILVWDTLLAQYCINGNRKTQLDLDFIAGRYGFGHKETIVSKMIKGGVCPSLIPKKRLIDYCTQDVLLTHLIFLRQREELEQSGLLPVMYTKCLICLALADIEKTGMCLDPPRVKIEYQKILALYKEIEDEIHQVTGGINPRSPQQIRKYLYYTLGFDEPRDYRGEPIRTPGGDPVTGIDHILSLVPKTPEQQQFKDLIERFSPLKTAKSTLEKMLKCCDENEGILHAKFNQATTRNHRISSSGKQYKIQLQNIDRDFKRLFKARHKGWKIADPDAPQLEFRVAGQLTGDPQIVEDVKNDYDVHLYTASVITKTPEGNVTDKQRAGQKQNTFKPVYGGKSGTPDERRYYKAFQKKYKTLGDVQTGWCYQVLRDKKIRTATGLIFYWPDVCIYDSGFIKYTNEIFNYPISNLATAEITMIGLVYLWYLIKLNKNQMFIVNTVHDAHIVEVPPEEEEALWEYAKMVFTDLTYVYLKKVYGIQWTIPLGVDMKIGNNWAEGQKYKYKSELISD